MVRCDGDDAMWEDRRGRKTDEVLEQDKSWRSWSCWMRWARERRSLALLVTDAVPSAGQLPSFVVRARSVFYSVRSWRPADTYRLQHCTRVSDDSLGRA